MKRINPYVLAMLLIAVLMHLGYSVGEYMKKPFGAYLASGRLLLSTGKTLTNDSRLQFQDNGVHDFQQNGEWSRSAFRKIDSGLLGNLKLTTESAQVALPRLSDAPLDNDLAFKHAYYIKQGSRFTLYRLPLSPENMCVYLRELGALRCFSRERPRE